MREILCKLPFPENGTFDRDCLNHLRKVLEGNEEDQRGDGSADLIQKGRVQLAVWRCASNILNSVMLRLSSDPGK